MVAHPAEYRWSSYRANAQAEREVVHSRTVRTIGVLAGTALAVSVALSAVLAPCGPFAAQEVRCETRPSFWSRAPT